MEDRDYPEDGHHHRMPVQDPSLVVTDTITTAKDTLLVREEKGRPEEDMKLYCYRYVIGFVFCCNLVANSVAQTSLQTIGDLTMDAYDISTIMFQSVTYALQFAVILGNFPSSFLI